MVRDLSPGPDETLDTILGGRVQVLQNRKGYRFSLDAVLLADFVAGTVSGQVADLGAGAGVVSLVLAYVGGPEAVLAVELQPSLLDLARRNVALNGMDRVIEVREGDIRNVGQALRRGRFDWVVSNPPYHPVTSGRVSTNPERAVARHEVACTLADVVEAAAFLVKPTGRAALVYPAARLTEFLVTLRARGLEPRRMRLVHSTPTSPAELVLVEAAPGGEGPCLEVEPPLWVHDASGQYAEETRRILWGEKYGERPGGPRRTISEVSEASRSSRAPAG